MNAMQWPRSGLGWLSCAVCVGIILACGYISWHLALFYFNIQRPPRWLIMPPRVYMELAGLTLIVGLGVLYFLSLKSDEPD